MKEQLNKMPYKPSTQEALQEVIQGLQDQVDPRDFRHYTEQLIYKLKEVIEVRGIATIN